MEYRKVPRIAVDALKLPGAFARSFLNMLSPEEEPMPEEPRPAIYALERYSLQPGRYELGQLGEGPTQYHETQLPVIVVVVGIRGYWDGWDENAIQVCPEVWFRDVFPVDPPTVEDRKDIDDPGESLARWLVIPMERWEQSVRPLFSATEQRA
jgi:hypothetical protein